MTLCRKAGSVLILGALFLWGLGLVGCDRSPSTSSGGEGGKGSSDVSSSPGSNPTTGLPGGAVAIVNGVPISKQEFDLVVSQFESMDPEGFQGMSPADRQQLFARILDQIIMVRLEIQEAQRQGIQVPEELVEQEYEAFKSTFPSEEVFLEVLHKGNTNPLIWKKGTRESFFMRKLEESMAKRLVVSEKEIQDYWDGNRESLKRDMIHARQVLVRTEPEAKQVLASLQQGSSFEAVVKEYSVDTLTKTKGGDLGWISRGDAFEEFERVTFLLKPQTISAPFKGKYGYHIVQVLGKKKAGETSLKDYREKIRGLIRQQKWQAQRESWLQGLKAEATIQLAPDFSLAQLQTQNVLKLKERYGDRMEFIHIDTYLDIDTTMQWGLETEPWTIVVDREGVVQARLEGMTGEKAIETEIRKVLS
jgi:hypothetical protein